MPALLLGFIVFLQSMSAAQALARKRHERLVADRELLGLGAANLAGALSGGFPVAGSISRSAVSHEAGANTPLASLAAAHIVTLVAVVSMGAERGNGSRGTGVAATPRAAAHCFTAVGGE